jgi:predicted dehydrogenase
MRIGIMSFAHVHADAYVGNLRRSPGVEFIGFSDTDAERGAHFSSEYNARWYSTHEALLAEKPDGVIVCSENANHREMVEMAANAGAHVLCEKPIEITLEDAHAMRDVCAANNVRFMTAFPLRFAPTAHAAKAILDRGDLGAIYAANGINHSEIPRAHRAWFAQKALAGGGSVMDHTVHLVDILRWYLNSEVVEVYAELDNPFYPGEIDVESAGIVLLTFANGVFASVDCSWSRPTWYPRWGHAKLEMVGEKGFFTLDAMSQHLTVYSKSGARNPEWIGWGADSNQAMINEFAASIRDGREPSVTWRDGYETLRVALACYESAEKKQPVRLAQ